MSALLLLAAYMALTAGCVLAGRAIKRGEYGWAGFNIAVVLINLVTVFDQVMHR